MTETTGRRERRQSRTQFDRTNRLRVAQYAIGFIVVILILIGAALLPVFFPEVALNLTGGGFARSHELLPRNTDIWVVYPDGSLRFATVFEIEEDPTQVSIGLPVAGPYVNAPEDVVSTRYFGALGVTRSMKGGVDNDSSRVYYEYTVERDPSVQVYGINVLTTNPPYIEPGKIRLPNGAIDVDPAGLKKMVAFGAPPQGFYNQVTVVVVFPPGTIMDSINYLIPRNEPTPLPGQLNTPPASTTTEKVLAPYRRVIFNGWTAYYFDTSVLTDNYTIRLLYTPPIPSADLLDPDIFAIDAGR